MSKAVKTVAGVAAAAVGFATGQGWLVAVGAGMVSQGIAKTPKLGGAPSQAEMKQIVRSSKEPARYMVGRIGAGGLLAWAQEQPGEQSENELLHLVYVLTEGTIDSLEEIYVNQEPVANAGDRVHYEVISGATAPNGYLLEHSPDWRDSQIGRGLTYVRVTLRHDPEYFATGIPDFLFVYRGCNTIYDPRTGNYGYSDNAALVGLWFLRERLGVPDDEIIWEMFNEAANISHEIVTNPDGSTERRYTLGGGFKADERRDRVLADIEAACGGSFVRVGGRWGLQVGAYYGPHELMIDENMVIGTVTGQTEASQADAVNTMRGRFVDPDQRWTETDYPAVSVSEWVEQDGGPIEDSLDLRLVTSAYQAQRLANMRLRRRRAGGRLSFPLNFRGYACRPGRVVRVELPSLNISGEFRIEDWEFSGQDGCKVTLQQEDVAIYDDAIGQPYDPMGFIRLPAGGIGSPTGLRYVVESVGEVVQGVLLWNPVDAALHYNVVIKHDGQAVQSAQVPAGVERCEIGGLVSGNYTAEVRARGRLGQSGPASINFSVNAPPMPERVITQVGNREITLIPQIAPGASLNGGHYRYYWTMDANASQRLSELLGEGLSFTHNGLAPLQTYYYYVQSVNAYGSSPFLRVEVETTLEFDEEMAHIERVIFRDGGIVERFQNEVDELGNTVEAVELIVDAAREDAADARRDAEGALESAREALRNGELQALEEEIRYSTLQAKTSMANAVMDVEHSVRIAEEFALAQQITTLKVTFNGSVASLEQELSTYADEQMALAQSVLTLGAEVEDNAASLVDTQQALVLDGIAQAIRNALLETKGSLGNAIADVEYLARTDQERSIAQQVTTLDTEFKDNRSSVRQELTSLTNEQGSIATSLTSLNAEYNENKASVNSRLIANSNATSATAGRLDQFQVQVGQNFASVQQDVSAVYDPRTGAVARAVTTVNANGRKGVLGIQVDGQTAEIIGIADQFAILNPVNNQLVTAFVVSDGRVVIPDALIRDASITNAKIRDGAITNAKIVNGAITNGKIENGAITNAKIADAAITTAKIGTAQVGTLEVAGQAITVEADATTNAGMIVAVGNGWANIQTLLVAGNPVGAPVSILGVAFFELGWSVPESGSFGQRIKARIIDNTNNVVLTPEFTVASTPPTSQFRTAGPLIVVARLSSNYANRQISLQVITERTSGNQSANVVISGRTLKQTTTKR